MRWLNTVYQGTNLISKSTPLFFKGIRRPKTHFLLIHLVKNLLVNFGDKLIKLVGNVGKIGN